MTKKRINKNKRNGRRYTTKVIDGLDELSKGVGRSRYLDDIGKRL